MRCLENDSKNGIYSLLWACFNLTCDLSKLGFRAFIRLLEVSRIKLRQRLLKGAPKAHGAFWRASWPFRRVLVSFLGILGLQEYIDGPISNVK